MNDGTCLIRLKIALVSDDAREIRVISQYLEETCQGIRCCGYRSGTELLQAMQQGETLDVVLVGDWLDSIDESAFVVQLRKLWYSPILMFLSGGSLEDVHGADLQMNGMMGHLARQRSLREILQRLRLVIGDNTVWVEQMCAQLYEQWKIPQPDVNCAYLTRAMCIACSTNEKLAVRKEILQAVAEQSQVTVAAVDSGLRRLIDSLETRKPEAWLRYKKQNGMEEKHVSTGKLIRMLQNSFLKRQDSGQNSE